MRSTRRPSARATIQGIALTALFGVLGVYAALTVNRVVEPTITRELLWAVGFGLLVGVPGLLDRRLFLLTPVVLLGGMYALLRMVSPLPEDIVGSTGQYSYYSQELRFGFSAYREAIFPLTLTGIPGLRLLIIFWVYLVIAAAAMLALGARRILAGAVVLLALLGFTLTVDEAPREVLVAGGFLLIVVALLIIAEAQNRHRWGIGDLASGLLLGGIAIAIGALTLQTAPGMATGAWQDWRTWRPFGGQNQEIVFNWRQNYPRLLDPQNEFPVMRVASPVPSYWRANTLEVFTGDAWLSSGSFYESLEPDGADTLDVTVAGARPPGREVTQRFQLQGISTTYLFVGGEPLRLTQESGGRIYTSGHGALRAEIPLQPPSGYEVTVVAPHVRPAELMDLGRDYPAEIAEQYLPLPVPTAAEVARVREAGGDWQTDVITSGPRGEEFLRIYGLNDSIVRGARDPYQIALRIERFLRNRYDYSLDLPHSRMSSPYAAFMLDTRVGYCQQFAGSMALLLRLNDVPARVAVGFTTGEEMNDGTYLVRTNNAHSWVEAYFPGIGWISFDPTPGREVPTPGGSSTTPGFESPFAEEPVPAVEDPAGWAALELPAGAGADPGADAGAVENSATLGSSFWLSLGAGLVAFGMVWPVARSRWRTRAIARGAPAQRMKRSLQLLRDYAGHAGLGVDESSTLDELSDRLEDELGLPVDVIRFRAQNVLYGGEAARVADVREMERLRTGTEKALGHSRGWVWTTASWYGGPRLACRLKGYLDRLFDEEPPALGPSLETRNTG